MNIAFYKEYFSDMRNRVANIQDFEFGTMAQVLSNKIRSTAKYPLLFLERYTISPVGGNMDNLYDRKYGALVIVDVLPDRNKTDEKQLETDARTEFIASRIREVMIADKTANMQYLDNLDVDSLSINYVSELFGGSGWRLSFEFDDDESVFEGGVQGGYLTQVATDASLQGKGTTLEPLKIKNFEDGKSYLNKDGVWSELESNVTAEEKVIWNGKADIDDIPTLLSELGDDETHRLTTDLEKQYWNAKANIPKIIKFEAQTDITEFQLIGKTILFALVFADGRLIFGSEIQGDRIVFNEAISQYQQVLINYITIP